MRSDSERVAQKKSASRQVFKLPNGHLYYFFRTSCSPVCPFAFPWLLSSILRRQWLILLFSGFKKRVSLDILQTCLLERLTFFIIVSRSMPTTVLIIIVWWLRSLQVIQVTCQLCVCVFILLKLFNKKILWKINDQCLFFKFCYLMK